MQKVHSKARWTQQFKAGLLKIHLSTKPRQDIMGQIFASETNK